MNETPDAWYFNTLTGEVEHGKRSSWLNRMGPYPSRESAENAFTLAKARSEAWDTSDEKWGAADDD